MSMGDGERKGPPKRRGPFGLLCIRSQAKTQMPSSLDDFPRNETEKQSHPLHPNHWLLLLLLLPSTRFRGIQPSIVGTVSSRLGGASLQKFNFNTSTRLPS